MTQDQVDRAIDTLHAPYPQRTIRTFRAAMKATQDPDEQAEKILEIIPRPGARTLRATQTPTRDHP